MRERREATRRPRAVDLGEEPSDRYRHLVDLAPFGILCLKPDGTIFEANDAAARLFGYPDAASFVERTPRVQDLCLDPADAAARMQEIVEHGVIHGIEFEVRRPDCSRAWMRADVRAVRDARGDLVELQGMFVDITDRVREQARTADLLEALRRAEEEGRELAARVATAQEEERLYLARELHDDLGQTLTTAALYVKAARASASTRTLAPLDMLEVLVDNALLSTRSLVWTLRSTPVAEGLAESIRRLVASISASGAIDARFEVAGTIDPMPSETAEAIFRIVQEALANVLRHARARSAVVSLAMSPDAIEVTVTDDGIGFSPRWRGPAGGSGLEGMRARAASAGGALSVAPQPGVGTMVRMAFPRAIQR